MLKAGYSRTIGLLEVLKDNNYNSDVDELASKFDLELDEILPIVHTAENLGLAQVKDGNVIVTDAGKELLSSGILERKGRVKEILNKLDVVNRIRVMGRKKRVCCSVSKDEVIALLEKDHPNQGHTIFKELVDWGRYGGLIRYDKNKREIEIRV